MSKLKKNKEKVYLIIPLLIVLLISISIAIILDKPNKVESSSKNTNYRTNINSSINSNNDFSKDETTNSNSNKPTTSNKNSNSNKSSSSNNTSSNKTSNTSSSHNSSSNKTSNINTSSNSNSNKPSNINTNTNNNKPVKPPVEEDKNDTKRKTIEKTYGIKILYGNEIGDYKPKGITPTRLTDKTEIEDHLNRLNTELSKYPKGFFNDFSKKGMPLTIYLIKSANGSFSGFTDYQFMNDIKLTLATNYEFEYTLHHEIMHYIDCYLNILIYPKTPYEEYEALNPTNFKYGSATSTQIYNMATNQRGAYFISQYGSSNVAEDRAEVFKFMMARAYAPIGCFEKNEIIRKKAEVISKQIKTYFPSVTGPAHWDRFIK